MFYSFFLTSKRKGCSVYLCWEGLFVNPGIPSALQERGQPFCIMSFLYSQLLLLNDNYSCAQAAIEARMSQEWRQSGPTGRLPNLL